MGFDTDGNVDIDYDNEDGTETSLSVNEDGVISGDLTINEIELTGDSTGKYHVDLPIRDFGKLTFSQDGVGGQFNLGDLGSVKIKDGEVSGQLNIGDNVNLKVTGDGVSGSLDLGDLGKIEVAADGSVSGNLGVDGIAKLEVGKDGNIAGTITTKHGTLNLKSKGTVYGELITPKGTLSIDEIGRASFKAPSTKEVYANARGADALATGPLQKGMSMTDEQTTCPGSENNGTQHASGHALASLPMALQEACAPNKK